ncbi:MAG: transporter [Thermoleophilaceae bacterium]|nr:transporter [Thermoleophilaceae bacterium]
MLKGPLLHPEILHALGRAGHSSRILIADGNYPHWTTRGPNAEVVFLNLAPGVVSVTDVLGTLADALPFEAATVMATAKTGPQAMAEDPEIWSEFRSILRAAGTPLELEPMERSAFYAAVREPDVALSVATGDQRLYANVLLTIGVMD